ncbi:hypothetical protein BWQ96_07398 [Gracilariopsis chorda]|uniref:Uncharacterized protein n=1 Tax=Gracilariopsis chorda TaxID=448386 RepID=A0A2V3IL93_9FLOR|nr:hypothetical protein BWQ96_07398 [Gracilariopsis chorda]|eukprot:PXF42854.1 hypothetical protein BWQ96_07398 [Gracilariopsis chorda]
MTIGTGTGMEEAELQNVTRRDVERWITVEAENDVVEGCVNDSMQVLEAPMPSEAPVKESSSDEEDAKTTVPERKNVPNSVHLGDMFEDLETLATECQVGTALWDLRRAKRAFLDAKRTTKSTERRQALIT